MQGDSFLRYLVLQAIGIYQMMIVIRAIMSWFSPNPRNPIYLWLIRLTEPFLKLLRRYLPQSSVDFSPIVAMLLLSLLAKVISGM